MDKLFWQVQFAQDSHLPLSHLNSHVLKRIGANDHHAQIHESTHDWNGTDPIDFDSIADGAVGYLTSTGKVENIAKGDMMRKYYKGS